MAGDEVVLDVTVRDADGSCVPNEPVMVTAAARISGITTPGLVDDAIDTECFESALPAQLHDAVPIRSMARAPVAPEAAETGRETPINIGL